ncbi:hypothetical protein ACH50O_01450 [Methylomonas sp. 2BW1-5-20]|uniref:hypothetical protein n=1 Tax=Methylomonas sp. 2BW1-5-20 TaxID=3376686 RepID=UPI00405189CD
MIAEKAELPAKFKKSQEDAAKVAEAAFARLRAAEAEFYAAREANRLAALVSGGVGHQLGMQIKAIDDELLAGADPRIADYRFEIGNIQGRARLADKGWIEHVEKKEEGLWGRVYFDREWRNNLEDVSSAMTLLDKTKNDLDALALSALSTAEVTAALRKMTDDLIPVLNKLSSMNPPWLDEFDEVRPPNEDGKPAYPYPLDAPQY